MTLKRLNILLVIFFFLRKYKLCDWSLHYTAGSSARFYGDLLGKGHLSRRCVLKVSPWKREPTKKKYIWTSCDVWIPCTKSQALRWCLSRWNAANITLPAQTAAKLQSDLFRYINRGQRTRVGFLEREWLYVEGSVVSTNSAVSRVSNDSVDMVQSAQQLFPLQQVLTAL